MSAVKKNLDRYANRLHLDHDRLFHCWINFLSFFVREIRSTIDEVQTDKYQRTTNQE